jgi:hypothetical protein
MLVEWKIHNFKLRTIYIKFLTKKELCLKAPDRLKLLRKCRQKFDRSDDNATQSNLIFSI